MLKKNPGQLTYDTERLPGKAQTPLPSSVAAAAAGRPDADDVLQPEHHDHHKLLSEQDKNNTRVLWRRVNGASGTVPSNYSSCQQRL